MRTSRRLCGHKPHRIDSRKAQSCQRLHSCWPHRAIHSNPAHAWSVAAPVFQGVGFVFLFFLKHRFSMTKHIFCTLVFSPFFCFILFHIVNPIFHARKQGASKFKDMRNNTNPHRGSDPSEKVMEKLRELNRLDIELYEFASEWLVECMCNIYFFIF